MSKEVKPTLPAKLNELVEEKKSNFTDAQEIAMNYAPFMEEVNVQMEKLRKAKPKKGQDPTPEQVEIAKRVRIDLSNKVNGKVRTQKDEDKEYIKLKGNFIQSLHNAVIDASKMTQAEAKEIEEFYERKEAKRKEKLANERTELLSEFMDEEGIESLGTNLADMEEEVFKAFLEQKKQNKKEIEEAERKAREEEEKKQAALKLHNQRKDDLLDVWSFLSDEVKESDLSEISKKEFSSIKSEAEKKFNEEKERKKKLEEKAAEQKRKDDQLDALQPYLYLVDNVNEVIGLSEEKFSKRIEGLKREDARIKKEKAQKEAEEKRKKEQEEAKRKAPDKEKLIALAEDLENYELPEVSDDQYKKIVKAVKKHLKEVSDNIKKNV